MSEIKEITCYETSDGVIHRTLKSCKSNGKRKVKNEYNINR